MSYILTISCKDVIGIVAATSTFLAENQCTIIDSAQFGDSLTEKFFLRIHFQPLTWKDDEKLEALKAQFVPIAQKFGMVWEVSPTNKPARLLLMVSRFGHCLNDLLFRCTTGGLSATIPAIVSNHTDFEHIAKMHNIPFYHLPVTPDNKQEQETKLAEIVEKEAIDLIVLARYMQVLSSDFCSRHEGRIINIHHSFLPSFKGASPYRQAYERGVKLIGATAHYVTANLDEGPIIEQEIARVEHSHTPEMMTSIGRDLECLALSRAIKWHTEKRILLNGHRTILFK